MIATTTMIRRTACRSILCSLSLVLFVTFTSHASAALMAPGASILASGEPDPTGGVVVGSSGPLPFATANYSGTLDSTVLLGDPSNPFGPGSLTFTYRLVNNAVSTGEIDRLTVNDYAGFLVDASFQTPPTGVPPTLTSRSGGPGDVVGFTFVGAPLGAGVLVPGSTSALLVVQTNAKFFGPTLASVINGQVTSVGSFAPGGLGGGIPEPCSVVLAAIGFIGLAPLARRKRSH
jgi:hypothetical protein